MSKRGKQHKLVTVNTDTQKTLRRSQVTSEQYHSIADETGRKRDTEKEGEREESLMRLALTHQEAA